MSNNIIAQLETSLKLHKHGFTSISKYLKKMNQVAFTG